MSFKYVNYFNASSEVTKILNMYVYCVLMSNKCMFKIRTSTSDLNCNVESSQNVIPPILHLNSVFLFTTQDLDKSALHLRWIVWVDLTALTDGERQKQERSACFY